MFKKIVLFFYLFAGMPVLASVPTNANAKKIKLIKRKKVPLLLEFVSKERKINVYGLTQSWIKVSKALCERAKRSIIYVAQKIESNYVKRKYTPGITSFLVVEANGTIRSYAAHTMHKYYFLQPLVTVKAYENCQKKKRVVSNL